MKRINVLELRCVTGSGGGPEKTILLSAAKVDSARFNVVVAYIRNANDPAYTIANRARELGLRFYDLKERLPVDPMMLARLVSVIVREKIDVIHAHEYKTNVLGVLLRPVLRFKLVSTVHGWVTKSPKLALYYLLDKLSLQYCDKVMCVSPDLHQELIHRGFSPERVSYLQNGIDTDRFRRDATSGTLRKELGFPFDRQLVAAIGRLSPEKDLFTFLRVASRVTEQVPGAHFLIVGEGPERDELERMADRLRLRSRITFLGQRHDILNIYNSLDLFLLTSVREGLPNVILEAMAMEVPVVTTNVGGVGELIRDGVNGRLFQPGDVEAIAGATVTLLRDRSLATRIAAAARQTVCRGFSFDERVRKLEHIYIEAMEANTTNGTPR
jgi:glycosyltransferase involved in cell wall biosynthesis